MKSLLKPRIIYNDDTISLRNIKPPHHVEQVHYACDYLKDTSVDILCWSFTAMDIAYSWKSKVIENFYDIPKPSSMIGRELDLTQSLYDQGIDYLPVLIDRAHENGLRFFPSFRMNDCHHKGEPDGPGASQFWKDHQAYRLWDITNGQTFWNAALDYSYAEVRDRKFKAIVEVANLYDIDGVEIDFCREPYTFPADQAWAKRNILTRFIERIRNALIRIGKSKGKHFDLIIRVPFSQTKLQNAGMDVETWVKGNMLDILSMGYWANDYNTRVEPWLTLCRRHGVLFYPSVQCCPAQSLKGDIRTSATLSTYKWMDVTVHGARAMAQSYLSQGVDGIHMFNHACYLFEGQNKFLENPKRFKELREVLFDLADMKKLKGKNKLDLFYPQTPIQLESHRPPQHHQTISFLTLDPDLENRTTETVIKFRQEVRANPHPFVKYDQKPTVPRDWIKYNLNGWKIPLNMIRRTRQPAGSVTGFKLGEHYLIQITLPGRRLVNGDNMLAFHIPVFPKETDPYIYIYDFGVEVRKKKR